MRRLPFIRNSRPDVYKIANSQTKDKNVNLCKADVSPKKAQMLARHSDINLTMNVYTHVDQDEQAAAIGKLRGV
jgi:hypothetical protein